MPGSKLRWNEWITFGAKYCDLSPDAWISVSVIGSLGPRSEKTLGEARLALFSDAGRLRTGVTKLLLALESTAAAAPRLTAATATTPFLAELAAVPTGRTADENEIARLEDLCMRHEVATSRENPELDWLNRPTYTYLEQRQHEIGKRLERHFISVQLPEFEHPVLFHEKAVATLVRLEQPSQEPSRPAPRGARDSSASVATAGLHDVPGGPVLLSDMEQHRDNPAQEKHRKLARSLLSAGFAKELKPDLSERRTLEVLVHYPPTTRLLPEDRELLWKFRYSLTKEKRALTKLLKCVDWEDVREAHQAHTLLEQWAEPDVQDLLELLGRSFSPDPVRRRTGFVGAPGFVGAAPWVREFAVQALRKRATDEQLLSYLLPLVQAIQYERFIQQPPAECPLAALLIERALQNVELANFLHWYLQVERCDERHGSHFAHVHDHFLQLLDASSGGLSLALRQQESLVGLLSNAAQELEQSKESRPKQVQRLQAMFERADQLGPLRSLATPLLMPLDPTRRIVAAVPNRATVFKSAMKPLGLTFETAEVSATVSATPTVPGQSLSLGAQPSLYSLIFKNGDDLRQDQLVLQMLMLIDKLLQEQGLDLKLTNYRALATGPNQGLVERVPDCAPVAKILSDNGSHIASLRRYLASLHPASDAPFGVDPEVMDTYVKSCAGYCVAMYLLGVGDRHMDNLMLCTNGALFHIDFGYILGRDPKPLPPKIRLTKEMVEAMGGADSEYYDRFRGLCCQAFNILRRPNASNLILNLLLLMVDGGVAHLGSEQDVIFVAERLCPDKSDEEASRHLQDTITSAVNALFPRFVEAIHTFAQATRA